MLCEMKVRIWKFIRAITRKLRIWGVHTIDFHLYYKSLFIYSLISGFVAMWNNFYSLNWYNHPTRHCLNVDFDTADALLISEVKMLLEHRKAQHDSSDDDQELSAVFLKTLEYCQTFSKYNSRETIAAVRTWVCTISLCVCMSVCLLQYDYNIQLLVCEWYELVSFRVSGLLLFTKNHEHTATHQYYLVFGGLFSSLSTRLIQCPFLIN